MTKQSLLNCDISEGECNKTKYRKQQIVDLAISCGIDPARKTKKQLCEAIVASYQGVTVSPVSKKSRKSASRKRSRKSASRKSAVSKRSRKSLPVEQSVDCSISESKCNRYKKDEIKEIALKCGIDPSLYKTKKDLCQAIVNSYEGERKPARIKKTSRSVGEAIVKKPKDKKSRKQRVKSPYQEDLSKKTVAELKKMLDDIEFSSSKPTLKNQMAEYLDSAETNGRCKPKDGEFCDGDFVCDASNEKGICINRELADERGLEEIVYEGNRIIGSKKAIKDLRKELKKGQVEKLFEEDEIIIDEPMPLPSFNGGVEESKDFEPEIMIGSPLRPTKYITPETSPESAPDYSSDIERLMEGDVIYAEEDLRLPEGTYTNIIDSLGDIDDVLRRIKTRDDYKGYDDLEPTQKQVLKCLGLL
jgi:hypothetical protein